MDPYFSAAVLQQDVDVLLVLEMVIKVHDVFVVQRSVQLDFSVDLTGSKWETLESGLWMPVEFQTQMFCRCASARALTFSRWCGLETRACGMILAA